MEPNSKMVTFMVTPTMYELIKAVAQKEDKTVSELMREVCKVAFSDPKEEVA